MKHARFTTYLFAVSMLIAPMGASAGGLPMDDKGMSLYTFDNDSAGMSVCYGDCAAKWPPYLGAAGATMGDGWTLIDRTDGTKQWAYYGKPVYFYSGDKKAGDAMGDGVGGVWHVIGQ